MSGSRSRGRPIPIAIRVKSFAPPNSYEIDLRPLWPLKLAVEDILNLPSLVSKQSCNTIRRDFSIEYFLTASLTFLPAIFM